MVPDEYPRWGSSHEAAGAPNKKILEGLNTPQRGILPAFCGGRSARAPFPSELKTRRDAGQQLRDLGGRAGWYVGIAAGFVWVVLEGGARIVIASAEFGGWAASRGLALGHQTYQAFTAPQPNEGTGGAPGAREVDDDYVLLE